jgi:lipid A disaccharide synthetase
MQTVLSPEDVAREVSLLLLDQQARSEMVAGLAEVKRALCEPDQEAPAEWRELDVSERVARCVFEMVAK